MPLYVVELTTTQPLYQTVDISSDIPLSDEKLTELAIEYAVSEGTWIRGETDESIDVDTITPAEDHSFVHVAYYAHHDEEKHYVAFEYYKSDNGVNADTVYVPADLVNTYGGVIAFQYHTGLSPDRIIWDNREELTKEEIEESGGTVNESVALPKQG